MVIFPHNIITSQTAYHLTPTLGVWFHMTFRQKQYASCSEDATLYVKRKLILSHCDVWLFIIVPLCVSKCVTSPNSAEQGTQ